MQISLFPNAKPHPISKEEKIENIRKYCKIPIIAEVEDEENMYDLITEFVWSPFIFSKYRKESDFLHCDMVVLDIDRGMTIEEAEEICERNNLMSFIGPSPSHTPDNHRFRMVFPLVTRITDKITYLETWKHLASKFPLDEICKDVTRTYFSCKPDPDYCVFVDGEMLKPATIRKLWDRESLLDQELVSTEKIEDKTILSLLYGEIPDKISKSVAHFFENAHTGMEGEWICTLNAAVFTLAMRGSRDEDILSAVQKASPQPLDDRDIDTIEKAIRDGERASSELQRTSDREGYKQQVKEKRKKRNKGHLI